MQTIVLVPHPATPCDHQPRIKVAIGWAAGRQLALTYRLQGDPDRIAIPAPAPSEFADGLWQHTCFEAFIAVEGSPAYREFNFSPSGQWASYAFSDYRQSDPSTAVLRPHVSFSRFADRLQLDACLAWNALPTIMPGQSLQLGFSAVIETTDGSRSYWALSHPGEQPDFHRRDAFTLTLSPEHEPS